MQISPKMQIVMHFDNFYISLIFITLISCQTFIPCTSFIKVEVFYFWENSLKIRPKSQNMFYVDQCCMTTRFEVCQDSYRTKHVQNIRLPLDFCSNNLGLLSVTPFYHLQLHSLLCDIFVLESYYIWIQVWFWPLFFFQFDISWQALFGIQSFGWKMTKKDNFRHLP